MKFGIHTGQQDCSYEQLRELWRLADRSGFDWASVWDHFYEAPPRDGSGPAFEAVATMAAMAAETTNVRIGCLVFCMPYRTPASLAKSAVTIDHISNGRVELGLGAGWHVQEFEELGYEFEAAKIRLDRLEEGAQIIRGMLGPAESTSFDGHYYRVQHARCIPKPVTGKIPIWIGGTGEKRSLRIAARYGDGWNCAYVSPESYQRKSQILSQWCEREGRDPTTIKRSVNLGFYMGATEGSAAAHREIMLTHFGDRTSGMLAGTPKEVIARVGEYADAGAEHINIALRPPVDMAAFQAFIDEVMPCFN